MSVPVFQTIKVTSAEETADLARQLGPCLSGGDTLLLHGEIGAGKTHFARCLIQALQDIPEDVPSPTFTLVQTYDTDAGEVWHADLYRLSGPDEVFEIGLIDAMESAICLVEWPDRLAGSEPAQSLHVIFKTDGDNAEAREILLSSNAPDHWKAKLEPCFV